MNNNDFAASATAMPARVRVRTIYEAAIANGHNEPCATGQQMHMNSTCVCDWFPEYAQTNPAPTMAAAIGDIVTERHAQWCRDNGHAQWTTTRVNGSSGTIARRTASKNAPDGART